MAGIPWLHPICYFDRRTMAFIQDGRCIFLSAEADLMDDLLAQFTLLFSPPQGLSPPRQWCHHNQLLPATEPKAVKPYRYAHHQKEGVERQCVAMLQQGIIRPSCSTFLAPVLLVKKADSSWRFCIDYHALNNYIIKDKFPILVVEELLDELRGATFFTKLDFRSAVTKSGCTPMMSRRRCSTHSRASWNF
jgi:hypothetical protein